MNSIALPESLELLRDGARGFGTTCVISKREIEYPDSNALVEILTEFEFAHPNVRLHPIGREDASRLIEYLVAYDQAYGGPTDALDIADRCAEDFVRLFGDEARFFTNTTDPIDARTRSWDSLTDATFDSGVVAVSATTVGIIWFEDED